MDGKSHEPPTKWWIENLYLITSKLCFIYDRVFVKLLVGTCINNND